MELRIVEKNMIEETSRFAREVFIDYYTDINGLEHATYMADKFLSNKAISDLIDNGAIFKLVIENNQILGFYEVLKEENKVFLSKLYVHSNYRHKGIGRFMFEDIIKYTKDNNLNKIYLTVNKHNTPSYNMYLHLGFKVIDSVVTDIGNNYVMDDYIMELTI